MCLPFLEFVIGIAEAYLEFPADFIWFGEQVLDLLSQLWSSFAIQYTSIGVIEILGATVPFHCG